MLIIIQCRFGSSRLPGKAMWPIAGVPMLVFLIRRLVEALDHHDYRIVLATTVDPRDDVVAVWGPAEKIDVFRGEEEDVLGRYTACLQHYPAEYVIRVTADNPLTCPAIIGRHVQAIGERKADYVQFKGLPLGAGVDIFSRQALQKVSHHAQSADEREHINLHLLRNPNNYDCYFPEVNGPQFRPELSLTVDTEADWRRVSSLFAVDEQKPWKISLNEAIKRMDR